LPDAFHHLLPNDNFYCQTPLKNVTFDLFGSKKCSFRQFYRQSQRHASVHLSSIYTDYRFSSYSV